VANVFVTARIVTHAPSQFIVVVSTSLEDLNQPSVPMDLEVMQADSPEGAEIHRQRLISTIEGRARRRGHAVVRVVRV
jgi:hypothetical protein